MGTLLAPLAADRLDLYALRNREGRSFIRTGVVNHTESRTRLFTDQPAMNSTLRDRIVRTLESLPDERGYQLLDYVEFLESKYAERTSQSPNALQRFAEGVEDTLRAGRVSASTIAETMGLMNKAMGVLSGVAAAGKSVASDVVDAAQRNVARVTTERPTAVPPTTAPGTPQATPQATPPATPAAAPDADPSGGTTT